jgi:hypothetical protein
MHPDPNLPWGLSLGPATSWGGSLEDTHLHRGLLQIVATGVLCVLLPVLHVDLGQPRQQQLLEGQGWGGEYVTK